MNFFDNAPINNNPMPMMYNPMMPDIARELNDISNRLKKLELRISRLENEKNNDTYKEPDTSLYMLQALIYTHICNYHRLIWEE